MNSPQHILFTRLQRIILSAWHLSPSCSTSHLQKTFCISRCNHMSTHTACNPKKTSCFQSSQNPHGLADKSRHAYHTITPGASNPIHGSCKCTFYHTNQSLWNHDFETSPDMEESAFAPEQQRPRTRRKLSRLLPKGKYIVSDEKWAKNINNKLKTVIDFQDPSNLIVECNPGSGLLTRMLLLRTKLQVLALDFRQKPSQSLVALSQNRYFKLRLFLKKGNILELRSILKELNKLDSIQTQSWDEVCPIKLIGTTFPASMYSSYINLLSLDTGARNHLYSLGRVESFLFVPADELKILGQEEGEGQLFNRGSLRSAVYKLCFDVSVLMKIPREAFGINNNSNNNNKSHDDPDTSIYLIHLVPRRDLPCPPEQLPGLLHLLRELRKKRGRTVMEALDSLYPDVTCEVLAEGFTEADTISKLTVHQVLRIYKVLVNRTDNLTLDPDVELDS